MIHARHPAVLEPFIESFLPVHRSTCEQCLLESTGESFGAAVVTILLASCSSPRPAAIVSSPTANTSTTPDSTPTVAQTSGSSPTPTPPASPSPTGPTPPKPCPEITGPGIAATGLLLVIQDYSRAEVRLARLDAVDVETTKGQVQSKVGASVIVLNGTCLQLMNRGGVTTLGQLPEPPSGSGHDVFVSPDLTQWIYALVDANQTSHVHLRTPSGDTVIADLPSPDGNASWVPFAWNSAGIYLVRQPTGLGGAGPFIDFRFEIAKLDRSSGRLVAISPSCVAYGVFDDGTMACRSSVAGNIEVRSPSGQSHLIQVTNGSTGINAAYNRVAFSADGKRVIVARNGAKDPVINYQMAVADLTASTANSFGPLDYVPDTWLPDGRVIADHTCVYSGFGGGPCNEGLDATYVVSGDGASYTQFYKLASGSQVVAYI